MLSPEHKTLVPNKKPSGSDEFFREKGQIIKTDLEMEIKYDSDTSSPFSTGYRNSSPFSTFDFNGLPFSTSSWDNSSPQVVDYTVLTQQKLNGIIPKLNNLTVGDIVIFNRYVKMTDAGYAIKEQYINQMCATATAVGVAVYNGTDLINTSTQALSIPNGRMIEFSSNSGILPIIDFPLSYWSPSLKKYHFYFGELPFLAELIRNIRYDSDLLGVTRVYTSFLIEEKQQVSKQAVSELMPTVLTDIIMSYSNYDRYYIVGDFNFMVRSDQHNGFSFGSVSYLKGDLTMEQMSSLYDESNRSSFVGSFTTFLKREHMSFYCELNCKFDSTLLKKYGISESLENFVFFTLQQCELFNDDGMLKIVQ